MKVFIYLFFIYLLLLLLFFAKGKFALNEEKRTI